jgi:hypothetical protein
MSRGGSGSRSERGLGVPGDGAARGEAQAAGGEQAQRAREGAVLGQVDALAQRGLVVAHEHRHALLRDDRARVHALLRTPRSQINRDSTVRLGGASSLFWYI